MNETAMSSKTSFTASEKTNRRHQTGLSSCTALQELSSLQDIVATPDLEGLMYDKKAEHRITGDGQILSQFIPKRAKKITLMMLGEATVEEKMEEMLGIEPKRVIVFILTLRHLHDG
mmetsp:Transcript_21589/g.30222  ORF Transcript_21589/g.30222 Transcript_21589/m.30222 type:complete len:117 (+) Transcript_21589:556-906(+)